MLDPQVTRTAPVACVTRGEFTLERRRRCALRSGAQFLPKRRQSIAADMAFDEAVAQTLVELGNATPRSASPLMKEQKIND